MERNTPAPTILVAEDHKHDKFILQEVFARAALRADLRFVGNGEELLDYLNGAGAFAAPGSAPTPTLILLDLNMPKLDGRRVLRMIRADERRRHLPIIALSTSESVKHITEAYSIGINAYLTKPANIPEYVTKIQSLWQFWMQTASLPEIEEQST